MEAGSLGQPCAYFAMFMRGKVVYDQVHIQMGRYGSIDKPQEFHEFLMAMPRLALGQNRIGGDIEGGE